MNALTVVLWAYGLAVAELFWRGSPLALGEANTAPALLLILMVFVAMSAPILPVLYTALGLGLLSDLQLHHAVGGTNPALLGPHVVGFLAGAYLIAQLRGLVIREGIGALAAGTFGAGMTVAILATFWLTLRKLIHADIGTFNALHHLGGLTVEVVYASIVAVPLGWLLHRFRGPFGFTGGR